MTVCYEQREDMTEKPSQQYDDESEVENGSLDSDALEPDEVGKVDPHPFDMLINTNELENGLSQDGETP